MEEVSYENPRKYTPSNIVFWEPTSKALKLAHEEKQINANPLIIKARRFLSEGCIKQVDDTTFKCGPVKDYNKTTYVIRFTDEENIECNCQGFNKKLHEYREGKSDIKPICSHVLAVKQFCYIEAHNKKIEVSF